MGREGGRKRKRRRVLNKKKERKNKEKTKKKQRKGKGEKKKLPKITNSNIQIIIRIKKQVFRLQITMNNLSIMQIIDSRQDSFHQFSSISFRVGTFVEDSFE